MTTAVPREVLTRLKKLALLPDEIKQSRWAVSITKLTTLKSLCKEPEVANRFVVYLARKTLERVRHGKGRAAHLCTDVQHRHTELMTAAFNGEVLRRRKKAAAAIAGSMRAPGTNKAMIIIGTPRAMLAAEMK